MARGNNNLSLSKSEGSTALSITNEESRED